MIDFKKIELYIFDLDGTLIDSALDLAVSLERALAEEGIMKYSLDDLLARISVGSKNLIRDLVNDDRVTEQRVFEYYIKHYSTNMFQNTKLFPQVLDIMDRLQTKSVALLSNKREQPCRVILDHFKITHHFKMILGGDSLKLKKPNPEPIFHICKKLGIEPEKTVMIGDSPVDIDAAHGAGAKSIGILDGLTPREVMLKTKPDIMVERVGDLLALLNEIAA